MSSHNPILRSNRSLVFMSTFCGSPYPARNSTRSPYFSSRFHSTHSKTASAPVLPNQLGQFNGTPVLAEAWRIDMTPHSNGFAHPRHYAGPPFRDAKKIITEATVTTVSNNLFYIISLIFIQWASNANDSFEHWSWNGPCHSILLNLTLPPELGPRDPASHQHKDW